MPKGKWRETEKDKRLRVNQYLHDTHAADAPQSAVMYCEANGLAHEAQKWCAPLENETGAPVWLLDPKAPPVNAEIDQGWWGV